MNDIKSQITAVLQSLQHACATQDFDQMRTLDDQLRSALQALTTSEQPKQVKVDLLREVGSIYQTLSLDTTRARAEIADELMRMKREHKVATAYLNSSLKG